MELSKEDVLEFERFVHEMRGLLETADDSCPSNSFTSQNIREAHDKLLAYKKRFFEKMIK